MLFMAQAHAERLYLALYLRIAKDRSAWRRMTRQ